MHIILLSGGSGKRLWPLSNDTKSKQFLKLLPSNNNLKVSMVQRVHGQLMSLKDKWDSITVAASTNQKEQIELQLGKDVNIVLEPERRDTFAAIALAASYLKDKKDVKDEEVIVVLPVDSFVENDFFEKIGNIENELMNTSADLMLIGAEPQFPSEKYGYILPENKSNANESFQVQKFTEKPTVEVATELINKGALWNCGVFGFKLKYLLNIIDEKINIKTQEGFFDEMIKEFNSIPKISFDYAIVEKANNIRTISYDGEWKDLGTWETFTEEMTENTVGESIYSSMTNNTHIINQLNIPLTVLGINNSVVVASQDGILVAEKGETFKLKELINDINNRPMQEDRRWGSYSVLDYTRNVDSETLVKKIELKAGEKISYQYHNKRSEVWTISKGKGILYKDGVQSCINTGETVCIDVVEKHAIYATENMELIEVQIGTQLIEEDIVRIEKDWKVNTDIDRSIK